MIGRAACEQADAAEASVEEVAEAVTEDVADVAVEETAGEETAEV